MSKDIETARECAGANNLDAAIAFALIALADAAERIADRLETEPVNDSTTHLRYVRGT